jgi:uncharacterized membrane protein
MVMLAIAGLVFVAIHAIPATPLRAGTVSAIGEGPYMGAFALLSLITLIWWVWAFEHTSYDTPLWTYPLWWPRLKALIMLFAFILVVAGIASPNPSSLREKSGKLLESPDVGRGIFAITRHPALWGFGIWGIAHLISQPNWRGFWFFGLFALTAIGGAWLQDGRKARTYGAGWERFAARTSFVPFVALTQGRARLSVSEIGWWRIGLAVILWAVILRLHVYLFGVPPMPELA